MHKNILALFLLVACGGNTECETVEAAEAAEAVEAVEAVEAGAVDCDPTKDEDCDKKEDVLAEDVRAETLDEAITTEAD